jgi:phenylacetate-CoA ligase
MTRSRYSNINVLVGAPVHLHRLARIDDEDWVLPKNQIHKVLTSTDTLAHTVRTNLQTIWGCEVFDHYGMTETGLGGGVECDAHHGFHLREADLYFEIIDPESGSPLQDGELGEVVVTTLTRTGMPLIRYRTGDLSRLIPGTCTCGSFIKRLDRIINRTNAGIQLDSGLLTQHALDEALFQIREVVDFSASYMESKEKRILRLAVRTINGQLKNIENDLVESLFQIPALQTELENGTLDLEFNPLEKFPQGNPNAMYKRMIHRQNT